MGPSGIYRLKQLVRKGRFELPRPCGHYALNVARLPFRHFGTATPASGTDSCSVSTGTSGSSGALAAFLGVVGDTGLEPVTSSV